MKARTTIEIEIEFQEKLDRQKIQSYIDGIDMFVSMKDETNREVTEGKKGVDFIYLSTEDSIEWKIED